MKIAIILPSLASKGPILIAYYLIKELAEIIHFEVYYFDNIVELDFPCKTEKISFFKRINFNDFDIVHSHQLRPDAYIFFHKRYIPKSCKTLSTIHQEIFKDLKYSYNIIISKVFGLIWFKFISKINHIVVLTQFTKNELLKYNQNVDIVHNGIPKHKIYEPIDTLDVELIKSLKTEYKIIGVSALLIKRKGIDQILYSLVNLPEFGLVCLGDGPEKDKLIQLAKKLKIDHRCIFLGYRKDGFRYFIFFDIYVISSYSEGFPISSIEAAAAKLPMVCSSIPVLKEIYSDIEVCFFKLNNTKSLIKAIEQCYLKRDILSNNIYIKYENNLSSTIMANNYLSIYKKLIIL